jgi:hypothetical protein
MALEQSKSSRWSFVGTVFQRIKHGRAQALQNLLFFLGKSSTVVVILSPLNRLIDMDCHPLFVFGKRRVGLLEIAEFPRFVRRTRYVGEQRIQRRSTVRSTSPAAMPMATSRASRTGTLSASRRRCCRSSATTRMPQLTPLRRRSRPSPPVSRPPILRVSGASLALRRSGKATWRLRRIFWTAWRRTRPTSR